MVTLRKPSFPATINLAMHCTCITIPYLPIYMYMHVYV